VRVFQHNEVVTCFYVISLMKGLHSYCAHRACKNLSKGIWNQAVLSAEGRKAWGGLVSVVACGLPQLRGRSRAFHFGRHSTVNLELARTRGILLSN
jgi:hypothetical protein